MNKNKTILLLKCSLVVFLMFLPSFFSSVVVFFDNDENNILFSSFNFDLGINSALSWLIHSIQVSLPIILLIMVSNESFKEYGFNKISIKEFILSLFRLTGLTIGFSLIVGIIIGCIYLLTPINLDNNIIEKVLAQEKNSPSIILINVIPMALVVFSEELCFRSYFYINLNKLLKNKWVCIIIINLLFSICHLYQGLIAVMGTFAIGLAFSVEFKKYNNIYTIAIFHLIRNIIALIVRTTY